ncbi:unnamed protein product [Porites lobata]|uniref:DNA helicase n=1 Tax=Porites lobata TaxID=104759 RepID=A0ABN8NLJ9_9CNID|nr:unnamed protein product [Porites lobata]
MIVVDKASMISSPIFGVKASTFNRMNLRPVVVLAGDKCQQQPLQTVNGRITSTTSIINDNATFSSHNAVIHRLHQQFRIVDAEYAAFLDLIRFIRPTQEQVDKMQDGIPNYNKHFPRSFMLNYGVALSNLSDDKILCRLFDWNCEWLSRPNIAISEMASTLKENWSNIMAYRGTVFTEEFVDDLRPPETCRQ